MNRKNLFKLILFVAILGGSLIFVTHSVHGNYYDCPEWLTPAIPGVCIQEIEVVNLPIPHTFNNEVKDVFNFQAEIIDSESKWNWLYPDLPIPDGFPNEHWYIVTLAIPPNSNPLGVYNPNKYSLIPDYLFFYKWSVREPVMGPGDINYNMNYAVEMICDNDGSLSTFLAVKIPAQYNVMAGIDTLSPPRGAAFSIEGVDYTKICSFGY